MNASNTAGQSTILNSFNFVWFVIRIMFKPLAVYAVVAAVIFTLYNYRAELLANGGIILPVVSLLAGFIAGKKIFQGKGMHAMPRKDRIYKVRAHFPLRGGDEHVTLVDVQSHKIASYHIQASKLKLWFGPSGSVPKVGTEIVWWRDPNLWDQHVAQFAGKYLWEVEFFKARDRDE